MKGMSATEFEKHSKTVEKALKELVGKRVGSTGIQTAYNLYEAQANKDKVVPLTFKRFCKVAEEMKGYSIHLSIPKKAEPDWLPITKTDAGVQSLAVKTLVHGMKTVKPKGWEALAPLIAIRKRFGLSQALLANHARVWQSDISRAEHGLSPAISQQFSDRYRTALVSILSELAARGNSDASVTLIKLRETSTASRPVVLLRRNHENSHTP